GCPTLTVGLPIESVEVVLLVLELEPLPFIANAAPAPAAATTTATINHLAWLLWGAAAADVWVTETVGSAAPGVRGFGAGLIAAVCLAVWPGCGLDFAMGFVTETVGSATTGCVLA